MIYGKYGNKDIEIDIETTTNKETEIKETAIDNEIGINIDTDRELDLSRNIHTYDLFLILN